MFRIVFNKTLQLSFSFNSSEIREQCADGWIFNLTEGNTAVSQVTQPDEIHSYSLYFSSFGLVFFSG